ncbi:MAG: ATP-binding cassette domain-containing protein [Myxococcales bacterium]|nr:ATP-binding cassette domain-containing protein [Myxococcales bacterium]
MQSTANPQLTSARWPSDRPTVEVHGLIAKYGARTVLNGVDVSVMPGEIHVILGGSGCGKSTLLKHMIGLYQQAGGDVSLLGVDLKAADEPERNAVLGRVGMLFQAGALLNGLSVRDNVALPIVERSELPRVVVDEMVRMKLDLVDLADKMDLMPPALSGGMKKRAALARAIATDPWVLFCDEPGAGLDPISMAALDSLLLNLRDRFGMSMVVVTHELPSIARIADRVTMLDQGKVIAQGPLREVQETDHPLVHAFFARKETEQDAMDAQLNVWRALGGSEPGAQS